MFAGIINWQTNSIFAKILKKSEIGCPKSDFICVVPFDCVLRAFGRENAGLIVAGKAPSGFGIVGRIHCRCPQTDACPRLTGRGSKAGRGSGFICFASLAFPLTLPSVRR